MFLISALIPLIAQLILALQERISHFQMYSSEVEREDLKNTTQVSLILQLLLAPAVSWEARCNFLRAQDDLNLYMKSIDEYRWVQVG